MKKEKKILNGKMREIIRVLHKKGGAMSALEIAKETGFAYTTVIKYLRELHKLNLIYLKGGYNEKNKDNNN